MLADQRGQRGQTPARRPGPGRRVARTRRAPDDPIRSGTRSPPSRVPRLAGRARPDRRGSRRRRRVGGRQNSPCRPRARPVDAPPRSERTPRSHFRNVAPSPRTVPFARRSNGRPSGPAPSGHGPVSSTPGKESASSSAPPARGRRPGRSGRHRRAGELARHIDLVQRQHRPAHAHRDRYLAAMAFITVFRNTRGETEYPLEEPSAGSRGRKSPQWDPSTSPISASWPGWRLASRASRAATTASWLARDSRRASRPGGASRCRRPRRREPRAAIGQRPDGRDRGILARRLPTAAPQSASAPTLHPGDDDPRRARPLAQ